MNRKNVLAIFTMLFLGLGIFIWEIRDTNINLLIDSLMKINFWWLIIAFISMILSFIFEALVLKVLLANRLNRKLRIWEYFRIPLIQALFNAITPFSSGGQPAQLVALMQSKVEAGRASSVLLMKFIVYQTMVMINFIIALIISFKSVADNFSGLSVLIIGGFIIHIVTITILLMIMYYYKLTKKIAIILLKPIALFIKPEKSEHIKSVILNKIDTFYQESLVLKKEPKKVLKAALLTFIQLIFYYLVIYFVLLALHASNVDIIHVLVLHVMIVMIVSIFPIPGGAGGAEFSFKHLFAGFLSSNSSLVLGMFLWRFITYYFGMFLGVIAVAKKPKND